MKPIVVIGSGNAGVTLIREVRQLDLKTPVILITKDKANTYYKPNLSKAISMGKSPDDLVMKCAEQVELDLGVQIVSNTVVESIDTVNGSLKINGAEGQCSIAYKDLVFAVGAAPIELPINGDAADQVLSVNTLDEYRLFRSEIKDKTNVLIIGAGFVGIEFASDLSNSDYQVDVVDMGDWPLQRSLPEELGSSIRNSFKEDTLTWHFGASVVTVNRQGEKLEVTLSTGKKLMVDVVLSAVGIKPNIQLAKEANISVNRGIVVDECLRTSHKNIYALGDCAELSGYTLPFIAPATFSAKALAKTLLGTVSELSIPNLAVAVKISTCPTVVCPSLTQGGVWDVDGESNDLIARYKNSEGQLLGFALTGKAISQKVSLLKECLSPVLTKQVELVS